MALFFFVIGYAAMLELDVDQFVDEVESSQNSRRVREDVASAEASGATGTPTFFVEGRRHVGPYDARSPVNFVPTSSTSRWNDKYFAIWLRMW